jgi:hypothetical protein
MRLGQVSLLFYRAAGHAGARLTAAAAGNAPGSIRAWRLAHIIHECA